jgi:ABC-2 type transport system ATP-binding protein
MREAAELTDRVAIMDHGRLLAIDTPRALVQTLPGAATLELATTPADGRADDVIASLRELPGVEALERVQSAGNGNGAPDLVAPPDAVAAAGAELRVRLYLTGDAHLLVAPAATALAEHGLDLVDVKLGSPTLEDVFIHLTGRALR